MSTSLVHRKLARILLLCILGFSTSACCFDGHWHGCGGYRIHVPVRHCR